MHAQLYNTLFIRKAGNSIYTQIGNSSEYSQNYLDGQLVKYTGINPSRCETRSKTFNTFEEAQTAQRKLHEVYKPWYVNGGLIKCDNISFREIDTVLDKLNDTEYDPKVMSNLQEILMDEHGYEQKYGYIYLVRLEGKNVLKIGYTGNMERRNLKDQFGCNVTVLDTKATGDMVKHEAKLHILCTEYKAKTTGYEGHDKVDRNGCSELYDDNQEVINKWNTYWRT